MKIQQRNDKNITFLGIYLLFFALLFCQYPLSNSLTGNTDTWLYIGTFELYGRYIASLFGGTVTETLYPSGPSFMYGDPCFFGALLYLPFRWLGIDVIWAWYCMMVVIYSTNAYAAYKFFGNWAQRQHTAFWAGVAISASAFSFGNMDSPNAFYLATMFLSLHYSNKFLLHGHWKYLIATVCWGAATLYFSAYIFVFQVLLLGFFWLYHYRKVLAVPYLLPKFAVAVALAVALVSAYMFFLFSPNGVFQAWNPMEDNAGLLIYSLSINDLVRPVLGNLLYSPPQDGLEGSPFFYLQHAVFPGILLVMLALVGFVLQKARGKMWLILAIIGFILAMGPSLQVGDTIIMMPMGFLYQYTELNSAIRVPIRFWYIALIGFIGLTLPAIDWLLEKPWGKTALVLVCAVYIIENAPLSPPKYDASAYVYPDEQYLSILSSANDEVVLDLPSTIFSMGNWPKGLNEYSREYIYTYWQTMHRQHSINGCNGFLPRTRLTTNQLICLIVDEHTLPRLQKEYHVGIVSFHKNMVLPNDDPRLEDYLQTSGVLTKLAETPTTTIYRIKPQP